MKKIYLLLLLVSFCGFSQVAKTEKINFSEYDDLKYIKSIDENFTIWDTLKRFYDLKGNLLYSKINYTSVYAYEVTIYPNGNINYTIQGNTANIEFTTVANMVKYGVNRVYSVGTCGGGECQYYVYMNNEQIYKGNSEYIIPVEAVKE